MQREWKLVMVMGVVLPFLASCASWPHGQVSRGELRLKKLHAPETMHVDLPYDIGVDFEQDGELQIKRVCFQWSTERTPISSSSLYYYASEVQDDRNIGSAAARWVSEGPQPFGSTLLCSDVQDVKIAESGRLLVKLNASNLKPEFNRLECQAEYLKDGQLKVTNKVRARVSVEE